MSRILYTPRAFSAASLDVIAEANAICAAYAEQGFDLTLRQLYYQFVARGLIPNRASEYKRLGSIINDARLAGLLDWDYIVDRTRSLRTLSAWASPTEVMEAVSEQFRFDAWEDQHARVEVWIEKDALVGVIQPVCDRNQVPYFSCRGYTSQSEIWAAAQRIERYVDGGTRRVVILHLGDHDPSGIDMTRDVEERLELFTTGDGYLEEFDLVVERIALNWDQIEQYRPPPNPAKITDSRAARYIERHGRESWELDALEPTVLDALLQERIERRRDARLWAAQIARRNDARRQLAWAAARWDDVVELVEGEPS